MVDKYGYVMMIQDKWWQGFLQRHREGKTVHSYVRTGFAAPKEASLLFFYVAKPVGEVAAAAEFVERKTGDPGEVWSEHGNESVLRSKEQFEEFIGDGQRVSFIRFRNMREAVKPVPLSNLSLLLGAKRLPRAGFYLDKATSHKLISLMG
jgi:predicted transcriptional regulator